MLTLAEETARSFRQEFAGKIMTVLWEKLTDGVWTGLTDNYIRVYTRSSEDLTARLQMAELTKPWQNGMWGVVPKPVRLQSSSLET